MQVAVDEGRRNQTIVRIDFDGCCRVEFRYDGFYFALSATDILPRPAVRQIGTAYDEVKHVGHRKSFPA